MKIFIRLTIAFIVAFSFSQLKAQAPKRISYQSVIRDGDNSLLANAIVGMQISILQGSSIVYSEKHSPTCNDNGLVTIEIGAGSPVNGNFEGINWAQGAYFIKVDVDLSGGTNYTLSNTQQLLSVPFALYAEKSGSSAPGADGRTILNGTQNPTTQGVNGDFYINTSTNKIFGPKTNGAWGAGTSLVGAQGLTGAAGTNGANGKTILSGASDPTSEGTNGDYFINASSHKIFGPKINGNWGTGISLVGTQGIQGAVGANGADGKTVLSGGSDPASQGTNGDFYINTTTSKIFGPKTNGNWGAGTSLIGAQGFTGAAGTNGADGKTVLSGGSDPTSQGTNGDFFINTSTQKIFGPKTNGVWGTGTSLIGAQGATGLQGLTGASGINGTDGKTILNGANDPTTEGADGDFYLNTATQKIFGPKTGGSWGNGVSLTGAQGQPGADGKTILNGSVDPTNEGTNSDFYLNTSTQKLFGPKTNGGWGSGVSLAGGGGWGLTGNAGTVDGTNFIGTTDSAPLTFKVNNQMAGKIGTLGNTFYGQLSGDAITTGNLNTGIGRNALALNTTGLQNTALGWYSLRSNTTGILNTAIGALALDHNATGHENTAVGSNALQNNTGDRNLGVGNYALSQNTTGSNNTALGYLANVSANNLNNATAIGANAKVNSSNTIQLGDGNLTQVMAGTGTNATLIAGGLQVTGGTPAIGKVLTSDATGVATWQAPAGGGWGLTGNAGTVDGTNFIGTTDNVPFNIRVNNQKAGKIDAALGNTFYGYKSGNSNSTGQSNTANGFWALFNNTTGSYNTALGTTSLFSNTDGTSNTAIGVNSLNANTTGSNNTASGVFSLISNTTGGNNTATGTSALFGNTIGNKNSAIGSGVLNENSTGSENTSSGYEAMYKNQTGNANTSYGSNSLASNVSGSKATAIGYGAMQNSNSQTTPFTNTNVAVGYESLKGSLTPSANTGLGNTAIGYQTLTNNSSGLNNIANGYSALFNNSTGSENTSVGSESLWNNTTGTFNSAVGKRALYVNKTGQYNAALGFQADVASDNLTNATAIGANAIVNSSNTVQLGDGNVTQVMAGIGTNATLIAGGLQVTGGTPAIGKVLTSGATGVATWQTPILPGFNSALDNINIGSSSLQYNTTGSHNIALGGTTLWGNSTGYNNIAIGSDAAQYNDGSGNVAIGVESLRYAYGGDYSVSIGYNTLKFSTATSRKTAIGAFAMQNHHATNGSINTNVAVGYESMLGDWDISATSPNTGLDNTAIGYQSLTANTKGNSNTANGYNAMALNTLGSNNTAIGAGALNVNTIGTNNTAIGYHANVTANNLSNASAIGANAIVTASNSMTFGDGNVVGWGFGTSPNAGADAIRVGTNATNGNGATLSLGGTWTNASDRNKKENFVQLNTSEVLSKIELLPITRWNYKGESPVITHIGPMAQDFYKLFKVGNDDKSISTIDPAGVALAGIQELFKQIEEMKKQIHDLNAENINLKSQVAAFKSYEDRLQKLEQLASKGNAQPHAQETK